MSAPETQAEHGADAPFNAGETIMHHLIDSPYLEVPGGGKIELPHFELFGIDMSISKHVVMMWIAFGVLLLLFGIARTQKGLVPRGLRNALEALVVYLRDNMARPAISGPAADRFLPYLLTLFFFIIACNLIGLIPGMATATGNISVTAALAGLSLVIVQITGLIKYGPIGHFKNLVPHGLPIFILPLMIVLELATQFVRPFVLCVRLFANMMAGHAVILAFIALIFLMQSWLVAGGAVVFLTAVYFLELLVAFIQAYIFTMLTAQFIGMSLHPSH